MKYKETVKTLVNLKWKDLNENELHSVMVLSAYAAKEFAESLRIALDLYPNHPELKEMSSGELETDNLEFEDYNQPGDHYKFLWFFVEKYKLKDFVPQDIFESGEKYLEEVRKLDNDVRAMSVFSREAELPDIFHKILEAKDWNTKALSAFKYYMERHILLDSAEGGHEDLVSGFQLDDRIDNFYKLRVDLYKPIETLFK